MFLRKWFESKSYIPGEMSPAHLFSLSFQATFTYKLDRNSPWLLSILTTKHITIPTANHNTDQNTTTSVWISNRLLALTMTCAQNVETSVLLPTVVSGTPFTRTIKFRLDISFLSSSGNVNLNFHVSKLPHFWTSRTTKLLFLNGKQ